MDLLFKWHCSIFLKHSDKTQSFHLEQELSSLLFLELFSNLMSSFLLELYGKHTSLMLWGYIFMPTNTGFAVKDSLSKLFPPPLASNVLQAFWDVLLLKFSCVKFVVKWKLTWEFQRSVVALVFEYHTVNLKQTSLGEMRLYRKILDLQIIN